MSDPDWRLSAACAGIWSTNEDDDPFFPSERYPNRATIGKRICHICPVKTECLQTAEDNHEIHGTWGEETASARRLRTGIKPRPPRTYEPCGTNAAVRAHYRNNEPLDRACQQAQSRHKAQRKANG